MLHGWTQIKNQLSQPSIRRQNSLKYVHFSHIAKSNREVYPLTTRSPNTYSEHISKQNLPKTPNISKYLTELKNQFE